MRPEKNNMWVSDTRQGSVDHYIIIIFIFVIVVSILATLDALIINIILH